MKIYHLLEKQLQKEPNFVTDNNELKKWVIIDRARNYDEELLDLLLSEKELKAHFFVEVKGTFVFKQEQFIQFLEQKNYLNNSYTQFKNKVGLTIDGKFLKQRNEVALVWPFKDCILEGGQSREEDKREEIFFNEVLAQDEITQLLEPKVLTNAKRYNKEGEQAFNQFNRNEEGTITDNLIMKGNNLLALHSLKDEFAGKVKLIYIDPPFNTGNDSFKYNDNFNHSTWLTFMRNRLEISKVLLKKEGLLFINIDDIEEAYLKVLCDEIFNRENFVNVIAVKSSTPSGTKTAHKERTIIKQKDLILVYKIGGTLDLTPQYVKRDYWDTPDLSTLVQQIKFD
jgi:adenine-specific DNA-methyltransferase